MKISGVGEMRVGKTVVGERGQIIGETGVGETGVGEIGVGETGASLKKLPISNTTMCFEINQLKWQLRSFSHNQMIKYIK